uniref:Anionic trypsin-1 n=1 Tax=Caligus rogercresseyi TaxID=217165 RepID=C1BMU4_CALRO|nr:Anionic trypsin-1 precursor [Caligus rogercresseyi]
MIRGLLSILCVVAFAHASDFSAEYYLIKASRAMGNSKIVGGEEVEPNSIPYQISFQRARDGFAFCGGSILDETTVITAAHCCDRQQADKVQIVAGEHDLKTSSGDEQLRKVTKIIMHEDYFTKGTNNDICLLKLESPLEMNDKVKPVTLPEENETPKGKVVVSGWGTLYSNGPVSPTLRSVQLNIRSFDLCNLVYTGKLDETMICAAALGKDSCQGDSGGPLMQNDTLVGVVSWGIGCAIPIFPGVYAKTSVFIDWINKNK